MPSAALREYLKFMEKKSSTVLKFLLGNLIPLGQVVGLIFLLFLSMDSIAKFLVIVFWIYLFPPLAVRAIFFIWGKPQGVFSEGDSSFWVWYYSAQFQVLYLRFGFLEEILRIVPIVYSIWLRFWGAKIGKLVYWAPAVKIMDRAHLEIGDQVLVGYGVGFTSHHIKSVNGKMELLVTAPKVEAKATLGGLSGLTPGSRVCAGELLPTTMRLSPFYIWKNGRRHKNDAKGADLIE